MTQPSSTLQLPFENRYAGILAPVFAIRTEDDLGAGDIEGMRQMIDWLSAHGFGVLQILPINETSSDNSPYNAISSMALEPVTLECRPGKVPGLSEEAFNQIVANYHIEVLRTGPVRYPEVKRLKRELLSAAWEEFQTEPDLAFQDFVTEQSNWIHSYGLFRCLIDEHGGSEVWETWPEYHRNAAAARLWLAELPTAEATRVNNRIQFFQFVQWVAYTQWRALKLYASRKGVALMGDIPFGISYYSADVFSEPEIFDLKWSGGAPPEPYFTNDIFVQAWGQNWGIPLYHWGVMRKDNFAWWRQRIRGVRDVFHLFRIDHVLGFFRIYSFPWRPEKNGEFLHRSHEEAAAVTGGLLPHFKERTDENQADAEANRKDGREYIAVIQKESADTVLVAEDLGVVPWYVRPCLAEMKIAGFKIPMWENMPNGDVLPGKDYPRISVTTFGTHDHEPLMGLWKRARFDLKSLDGLPKALADTARDARGPAGKLLRFSHQEKDFGRTLDDEIHEKMLRALFESNAWIAIPMVTDLLLREERFNVPGAVAESNWSQRMHCTVKELTTDPAVSAKLARISKLIAESGRIMAG